MLSEKAEAGKQGRKVAHVASSQEAIEKGIVGAGAEKIAYENVKPVSAIHSSFKSELYSLEARSIIEKAIDCFEHIPGAVGQNGPLKQVIEMAKHGPVDINKIKGPLYELEKALKLEAAGEKVLEFGRKVGGRDFDIITAKRWIECKNIDWDRLKLTGESLLDDKIQDAIAKAQSTFCQQAELAKKFNANFELHSKNKIILKWEDWLVKKKISFYEDNL